MTTFKTIHRITETLRDSGLSWLLPNLRQDFVVWSALNDQVYFDRVIHSKPEGEAYHPADLSPAKLALLALDQPDLIRVDPQHLLDLMDSQLIGLAMRSFDDTIQLPPAPHDLASAALMALSWLKDYSAAHSWNTLLNSLHDDPDHDWRAPIACLFGFLERPSDFLHSLVQLGSSSLHHDLAVHALLSNPLHLHEQVALLMDLCHCSNGYPLPAANRLFLLHALSEQRPQAAFDFCTSWLEVHPDLSTQPAQKQKNAVEQINQLLENLFQVEIRHIIGAREGFQDLLEGQIITVENLTARSFNQYINLMTTNQARKSSPGELARFCDQAVKMSELHFINRHDPANRIALAQTLAEQGLLDEANQLLPPGNAPLSDDFDTLFAFARIAFLSGDLTRSWEVASRMLELLSEKSSACQAKVWGEGFSLVNLGKLLLDLRKPSVAAPLFEQALQICPNDISLLKLQADCYKASHAVAQAAETLATLISLDPLDLNYHRAYAQSLEDLGDWETSLDERLVILASNQDNSGSSSPKDKYDYAHCAIMAKKPDLALQISAELLAGNPEDSQALIYTGEAYLLRGENDKGLDFLTRATQISPHIAEAWLALAAAQKKIYPPQTVIETLKNASQVVPESAQIHYALGDVYIQGDEPTLALPELQSAVELSPDDPQFLVSYGGVLQSLGHIEACRGILAKAYRLEPDFPGLAQVYAKILVDLGQLEAAMSPLETLINSNCNHDLAPYLDYARCLLTLHKQGSSAHPPMKALIALNEVLQIDPNHAEAKALTAEALSASGENELAFQAYREALDTALTEDKDWFERLSFGLGCVAGLIGKHDIAIASLQEAGQINPNNPAISMALSDAYISANLPEDAIKAARNVLVIQGDDPDNLAWFAGQVAKISDDKKSEIFNSVSSVSAEYTTEALAALSKAIQLGPTRTDLLVRLGNFQSRIGKQAEAQSTFASIASFDFATVEDLLNAGVYLATIEDHSSAIACLEKGISIDQKSDHHDPLLYASLAQEYVRNNDHTSAINTLNGAIDIIPDDDSLILEKVKILLELGQSPEALNVIETTLQNRPRDKSSLDLLFLASRINRSMGDFATAVRYAGTGVASSMKKVVGDKQASLPLHYRTQLAEIARALLQPEQAYQILQAEPGADKSAFMSDQDYLDYILLHTELALDTGKRLNPDIQDVRLESTHPSFIRLMSINARLVSKAGNDKQAEQLFQLAYKKEAEHDPVLNTPTWLAPFGKYLDHVSLIGVAQDLGIWDQAMTFARSVAESAPGEPLSQLNLAKTMVLQAEFSYLCETFEVTHHQPCSDLQPSDAHNLCIQYLDQAKQALDDCYAEEIAKRYAFTDDQICRWQVRAGLIYGHAPQDASSSVEILSRQETPGDTAALIHHLVQTDQDDTDHDALTRIVKLARLYPRNPSVILPVALALQDSNPQETMKSLESVLQHNPTYRNSGIAFCNILLARLGHSQGEYDLARQAIENAISYWSDEPNWHKLAARIYLSTTDVSGAIRHLQDAAKLAPNDVVCHMHLGTVLFEHACEDTGLLRQALSAFQDALALEPKNVAALTQLAKTYSLLKDFTYAEVYARDALALAPEQAGLYQLLSEIALEKKDFQASYEYANQAIQINPKEIGATILLARSLSAMGRHDEALARLNTVIPLVQEARSLQLERVNIVRKVNGPQIALNELKSLVTTYPDDFNVLNALAKSFFEVDELVNAVAVAQQALNCHTGEAPANERASLHLLIGQVLHQSGQLDQSIQHLSDAIQLAPNRLEPYLELGLARKERREYEQALEIFERATMIAPNDPRAPFQAGMALKESKDYKSSETMLRRAVSLAPNDLTIRRQLAAVVALNLIHNPRSARVSVK